MIAATILASIIGKYTNIPEVIVAVIAGIPMIPGLAMIQGFQGLFSIAHVGSVPSDADFMHAIQQMFYAGVVIIILIGGIIFPIILITRKSPRI